MHTILGINGATGIEIAKELNRKSIPVRGVSRREAQGNWEHRKGDVMNLESLTAAIDGSSIVYCCVGLEYDIKIWKRDWLPLIENVIQACLATKAKLIFVDNVYMYGLVQGTMTESTPMTPSSEKGKVRKAVAEKLLDAFAHRGLEGCIARSADFYGPDCEKSMIAEGVFKNITNGKSMQWLGRMNKKHAYTFTPDIGRACVNLALSDKMKGDVWHLPTAEAITATEFTNMVANEMNVPAKVTAIRGFMVSVLGIFIPILKEVKEMMYQYDEDYIFSSAKYENAFGEKPTPYKVGIKETVNFYKK
jgi:nucleoside-diphosphate-sugar epimerase